MEILFAVIWIVLIQSSDNFAHATTAELLWHVQNCHLIASLILCKENINLDYEHIIISKIGPMNQDYNLSWTHFLGIMSYNHIDIYAAIADRYQIQQ